MTALELVSVGTLRIDMGPTTRIAGGAAGTRVIVEFGDVTWQGERVRARRQGALQGDWLTIGADDVVTLDIRLTLATEDGALLYVHGLGRTDAAGFPQGGPLYFTPLVETADPRYRWLNQAQLVGKGQLVGQAVVFELYQLR